MPLRSAAFVLALAAAGFSTAKPPAARKIVTASPWAKRVTGTTLMRTRDGPIWPPERRRPAARMGPAAASSGGFGEETDRATSTSVSVAVLDARALIRWESAPPVLEAERELGYQTARWENTFKDRYVVSVTFLDRQGKPAAGLIPTGKRQRDAFLKSIAAATTLTQKGKDAHPPEQGAVAETPDGTMLLFYFSRFEMDRDVTFTTRMYPLRFQAKFKRKDIL